ncbi:MAG: methionine--tRNA ligase [Candidatus Nanoarchaeia archaeon]
MPKAKTLVTSALPYVNNLPHLGTMVCIISADVYTRYLRLVGHPVLSVVGTDEHGTTTEVKAMEEGITPQEVCDKYYKLQKEIYEWFNCDYDCVGRSSSKENNELTNEIFLDLHKNGYIKEDTILQAYDPKEDRYLPDRFVGGTCPYCKYEEARGDQCENCGKLLDPNELINPVSRVSGAPAEFKKTTHLFMDLPKIEPKLREWMQHVRSKWSANATSMTDAWLKDGLRPRCISRDLKWGIPIPLEGFKGKVFYSWFDAPIGYIGITKENKKHWDQWWNDPEDTRLVQFMGKDNIPFHTILFPGFLLGTDKKWALVDELSVNEFLNYEGGMFSKSRNIGVFGDTAKDTGIPADVWRYYIMVNRPERSDTEFTWDDFATKLNNELVGNFGNLVYRTLSFINRFYDGIIPTVHLNDVDKKFLKEVQEAEDRAKELFEEIKLKDALKEVMHISKLANQYFQMNEPWKVMKEDSVRAGSVLAVLANVVKDLSIIMWPFMPKACESIREQLGISAVKPNWDNLALKALDSGNKIGEASYLFKKVEEADVEKLREEFGGVREFAAHLKVAEVKNVQDHKDSDKLYVITIDIGEDKPRTICAGLKGVFEAEDLVGKHIIVVSNLKPAKLRGVESNGMLLVAQKKKKMKLLEAPWADPGTSVEIKGFSNNKNIIPIEQFAKLKLHVRN